MRHFLRSPFKALAFFLFWLSHTNASELWLLGGDLQLCSERHLEHCQEGHELKRNLSPQYQVTKSAIQILKQTQAYLAASQDTQQALINALSALEGLPPSRFEPFQQSLDTVLKSPSKGAIDLAEDVSVSLTLSIADAFSLPASKPAQFALAASRSRADLEILKAFAKRVEEGAPSDTARTRIGLIAGLTPQRFNQVDYYQNLLVNLGFEPVWLPLNRHLMLAEVAKAEQSACSDIVEAHQDAIGNKYLSDYPDIGEALRARCKATDGILAAIGQIQGLVIASASPADLLTALHLPSGAVGSVMKAIGKKFEQGKMPVLAIGSSVLATSGGTLSNRRVAMLTGGDSQTGFQRGPFTLSPLDPRCTEDCPADLLAQDLTYRASGGLGLFPFAPVDVLTSRTDGQAKLALVAAHAANRFAVGIDEDTALIVATTKGLTAMSVRGAGGVTLFDLLGGVYKIQGQQRQVVATSHYLGHGDSIRWQPTSGDLQVGFGEESALIFAENPLPVTAQGRWRSVIDKNCGNTTPARWRHQDIGYIALAGEETRFALGRNSGHCHYINMTIGMEN